MGKHKKHHILVVDDEPLIRKSLYEILRIEGFFVDMASTAEEALTIINKEPIDIVVTDLKLPQMNGLELLREIKKGSSKTEVILITGYGTIESAVEAMKIGACDYITKPIDDAAVKMVIRKIIEKHDQSGQNEKLKELLAREKKGSFCNMIGSSEKMQNVYRMIESVASTNATILITGESGTGKGLIARAIHHCDRNRSEKPFIEISCGALTETLLESELFGHVKGAFTGAIKDKPGRFEYANGGTIFLDEIDAFSPSLQVKLLRVLQDGVFERVGDNVTRHADVRVIVATNRYLPDLVDQGEFREDLYYRINVIAIEPPPLRERKGDINSLVNFYVQHYSLVNKKVIEEISDEVIDLFSRYQWPGNVRELENAIEGAVIMAKSPIIKMENLTNLSKFINAVSENPDIVKDDKSLRYVVEEPERDYIISILKECNWNRNKAASKLGINRTTLYNKMKKYKIFENEKSEQR